MQAFRWRPPERAARNFAHGLVRRLRCAMDMSVKVFSESKPCEPLEKLFPVGRLGDFVHFEVLGRWVMRHHQLQYGSGRAVPGFRQFEGYGTRVVRGEEADIEIHPSLEVSFNGIARVCRQGDATGRLCLESLVCVNQGNDLGVQPLRVEARHQGQHFQSHLREGVESERNFFFRCRRKYTGSSGRSRIWRADQSALSVQPLYECPKLTQVIPSAAGRMSRNLVVSRDKDNPLPKSPAAYGADPLDLLKEVNELFIFVFCRDARHIPRDDD